VKSKYEISPYSFEPQVLEQGGGEEKALQYFASTASERERRMRFEANNTDYVCSNCCFQFMTRKRKVSRQLRLRKFFKEISQK
jgi:hypothetical protein